MNKRSNSEHKENRSTVDQPRISSEPHLVKVVCRCVPVKSPAIINCSVQSPVRRGDRHEVVRREC